MKPQSELHGIEDVPWTEIKGAGEKVGVVGSGAREKILSQDPDNADYVSRLLKIEKGFKTTVTTTHPFWEEVYVLKGTLYDHLNKVTSKAGYYCCRHPGMPHGPFEALEEVMTFEIHYLPKD